MKDRHGQDRQSRAPDFLPDWGRALARFCSTADHSDLFVWPVWLDGSDTDIHSARFFPGKRQPRGRNDLKWRAKSKWQLQPPHIAHLRSRLSQSSKADDLSNVFFLINDRTDAGTNPALWNNCFAINLLLTGLSKLRLFEPRGHDHGGEEQRGREIIRRPR